MSRRRKRPTRARRARHPIGYGFALLAPDAAPPEVADLAPYAEPLRAELAKAGYGGPARVLAGTSRADVVEVSALLLRLMSDTDAPRADVEALGETIAAWEQAPAGSTLVAVIAHLPHPTMTNRELLDAATATAEDGGPGARPLGSAAP